MLPADAEFNKKLEIQNLLVFAYDTDVQDKN